MHLERDLAEQHAADLRKLSAAGPRRGAGRRSRFRPTRRAPRRLLVRRRLWRKLPGFWAAYAAAQR